MAPKKENKNQEDSEILKDSVEVESKSNQAKDSFTREEVAKMIAEAFAKANKPEPINPKRVSEHQVHLWRIDGKWVVDFIDRNTDPYIKKKVFAYEKFNPERREVESWIELKFQDGSTKDIALKNYVGNRIPVYCTIVSKKKIDKSYTMGTVEKKDWKNDKLVGTGVEVEQLVELYEEFFTVRTPEGEEITVPDYVLA